MLFGPGTSRIQFLKQDTLVMIQTKFGLNWPSSFRGEDFWKSYGRTDGRRRTDGRWTDGRTDDGRKVMTKAHMALWARWAKNAMFNPFGPLVSKRVSREPLFSSPRRYIVVRIIVLKFYRNRAIGTKVIARKLCVYRQTTTTTTTEP